MATPMEIEAAIDAVPQESWTNPEEARDLIVQALAAAEKVRREENQLVEKDYCWECHFWYPQGSDHEC